MLKGHVFKQQIFGNQIFALFINTFLNGKNGISDNYKNGMKVTYSGNTLTIQSGAVCIQGRFLEEDISTDIIVETDTAYCKLVLEIDLSKQNTESQFNQATYKIVKSISGYPALTQNNIVKNNTGIYQYELARFKISINGITDFKDMRTFLNFSSIYKEIEQHIKDIDDGSIYIQKNNIATLVGTEKVTVTADKYMDHTFTVNYPEGFTKDNCVVLAFGSRSDTQKGFSFGTRDNYASPSAFLETSFGKSVSLLDNNIVAHFYFRYGDASHSASSYNIDYKIVLMKI